MAIDEEVWDEEGDVEVGVEGEEEEEEGARGKEDFVNVDGDVDVEMVGNDEILSNRGS